jgi:hypothetical protein
VNRLKLDDRQMDTTRHEILDELTKQAQELNMGY